MKRKIILMLLIFTFLLPFYSCDSAANTDITVYITSSGQKYHKENCRYVRGKAIEIKLSKALSEGYAPCKVCKPPTKKDLEKLDKE